MPAITIEVEGAIADWFRAYGTVNLPKTLRSKSDPSKTRESTYPAEDCVIEGPVSAASFTFDAPQVVNRVVLYRGDGDEQTVVGSADVEASGTIEVQIVEAALDDFE